MKRKLRNSTGRGSKVSFLFSGSSCISGSLLLVIIFDLRFLQGLASCLFLDWFSFKMTFDNFFISLISVEGLLVIRRCMSLSICSTSLFVNVLFLHKDCFCRYLQKFYSITGHLR